MKIKIRKVSSIDELEICTKLRKEVFGIELKVRYYDGIPSSVDELEETSEDTTNAEEVTE